MKTSIITALKTALTSLAGLGGFLVSRGLIDQADVDAVNAGGATLADALAVVLAAVAMRGIIFLATKLTGKGVGLPLVGLLGTVAAIGTLLPSCSSPGAQSAWAVLKTVPIRSCVTTDYGTACYSSKRGIEIEVDASSGK